jgi:hypothetical protein
MLTLEDLKGMAPNTVFAQGETVDSPEGINFMNSGIGLRWVAVRGGIWDWAMYAGKKEDSYEQIRAFGDKVHDENTIRRLVPCDDKAFKMYRF